MNTREPVHPTTTHAGALVLTVWPDTPLGEHRRYAYRIEDSATGQVLDGRDLFTGAGAPVSPDRAMRDLAAYLTAAGDARQYAIDNPGRRPEHEGLFPGWVAEASRQNADALALIVEPDPPEPLRRSAPDPSWFERPHGSAAHTTRGMSL
ncbi:hypothetical protein AB2L57_07745 [Microbacterium sp. HA-8]|uniref:hypothetical protein n=1 Tax=Microbacterium sp. HA-8 TaxID=3234200 RepID=UPI0038F65ECC